MPACHYTFLTLHNVALYYLLSGDEEYRSEEAMPQLGRILAKHHGFKCTVLFAIDKATGEIAPTVPLTGYKLQSLERGYHDQFR